MQGLNTEVVLNALRTVQDPELHKDLVTLKMIEDLKVEPNGKVSVRVILTTPACPLRAKIEGDVRTAIMSVPGVTSVDIKMDARVKARVSKIQIPGVAHVIAVSSGKGGVGKSTVAVNLACALTLEGAKVGLMDVDVYGPNTPTMMGLRGPHGQPEVELQVEQAEDGTEFIIPPVAHGVKVMSMGLLVEGDQPMVWRGPMLHGVVNQFCRNVRWGELDYLVVDMPPGTGDVQLSLGQLVPVSGAVLVTTPQEVSLQDVRKAFHMFEKVNIPVLGIVENMSYFRCDQCEKKHFLFGEAGGKNLAERFQAELLAQLPIVPQVREGGDSGRPVVVAAAESRENHAAWETAQAFRTLARRVAGKLAVQTSESPDELPEDCDQKGGCAGCAGSSGCKHS